MATTRSGEIIVSNFRGLNVKDNPLVIDDSECQIATNVIVTDGAVEIRGGFDLHSTNASATDGITMMTPYYKRDGTAELVFANDDDYYFITAGNTTWTHIGDYGTAVNNPYAFQYKDKLIFGTGSTSNTPYKYDSVAETVTDTTIAFVDSNPDTITDSNSGFGNFRVGDVITVSGSASNDGTYTLAGVAAGTLTLIGSDTLVAEAAGATVTISSTGFSTITSPPNANGDLRFYSMFLGKNAKFLVGGGLTADVDDSNNITTVYSTTDLDDWSGGSAFQVGPSDGTDVTGLVQNNNLVIQKEKSRHYWDEFYEENGGSFELREFGVERSAGGVNHESLVVIDGDVVSLTGKGRSVEGFGLEGTAQGNARPKQYATNINPIINNINWQKTIVQKTRGMVYDRKVFMSTPFLSSQFNNIMLVGDWDTPTRNAQPSWTTWSRSISSMAVFRDSNGEDQLYLGDALQPNIYVYNPNSYSDNGLGYVRRWRSKKFALGRQTDYNEAMYVIIEGFMRTNTEFILTIIVDGSQQSYLINSNQLVNAQSGGGGYIGDSHIGDEHIGGNGIESDRFRYQAVAEVPNALRYCKNIEIEITNSEPGQYWSLDYLSINEQVNYADIPANHKNLTAI